ncbi:hypothetical protein D9756_003497 [Leucocoprinus leucothites]|uniref:Uncharacterized protein n=1 Tax=Leucocoprinus leucothites TaxID=201217 RepID=A0A8H5LJI9_9AGAR|nr:hypothetical protein D9756_003497 [Leucoagaricus leucothites]
MRQRPGLWMGRNHGRCRYASSRLTGLSLWVATTPTLGFLLLILYARPSTAPVHHLCPFVPMATPASSATSPSPPIPYLSHTPVSQASPLSPLDAHERELRKHAVQKFLARAEISMVTRALRARLSYASYKAIHNVSHVPIRELEGHLLSQSQAASFNRTIAAKRKSAGPSSSHYSNSSIPSSTSASSSALGAGASTSNAHARRPSGNMPPPMTSSPRAHHPTVTPSSAQHHHRSTSGHQQSLYSSILAPPPPHVAARTVLNANDPPVPPSSRPAPSPRVRTVKPSPKSAADGSRTHSKAKQPDKKAAASPERRKAKRASLDNKAKGKHRSRAEGRQRVAVDPDGDVDMKAAATLTSLLMHHHSRSYGGSTHSPRSSIDGSETGSTYSYSQSFAQSSARSTTATSPPGSISSANAMMGVSEASSSSYRQQQTPPPGPIQSSHSSGSSGGRKHSTPRPTAPTDNEAADLMLFLATSPSPARPTPKQRDPSSYRTLGGNDSGALRSKGRILFPSASAPDVMVHDEPMPPAGAAAQQQQPTTLARTSDGNYTLSGGGAHTEGGSRDLHGANASSRTSPSSTMITPGQLLPPPSLPSSQSSTSSSSTQHTVPDSPLRNNGRGGSGGGVGGTPSAVADFNFNEFINASPSPSRSTQKQQNTSLRADVGRKLFEEEQMRFHQQQQGERGRDVGGGGLGAGIDIVRS